MGMEDFFLGALGGAAQAGAQGASVEFQNEQELLRQQSLLDLQNRYKSKQLESRRAALLEAFPEQAEELNTLVDVGLDPVNLASNLVTSEQSQAEAKAERQRVVAALDGRVDDPEAFFDLLKGGIDPTKLEQEETISMEEAAAIGRKFNMEPDVVRALARTNALNTGITQSAKAADTSGRDNFLTVINRANGNIRQLPKQEALIKAGQTDDEGNQIFAIAKSIEDTDEGPVLRTDFGDFPLPAGSREDAKKQLSAREKFIKDTRDQIKDNEQFQQQNLSYVDITELDGQDIAGAATGPIDAFVGNVGRITPLNVGENQIKAGTKLANLRTDVASFFQVASAKPLSAVFRNLEQQVPMPNMLQRLQSDKTVILPLENLASSIKEGMRTAEMFLANQKDLDAEAKAEAKSKQILGPVILSEIETMLANRKISNLRVPIKGGSVRPLIELTTTEELKQIDFNKLSQEQQNLVGLWHKSRRLNREF